MSAIDFYLEDMAKRRMAFNAAVASGALVFNPKRFCNADGTHHFSEVKKLALSGRQYLYAVNTDTEANRAMLIGTAVHWLVLGARPGGKPVIRFDGDRRSGKTWDSLMLEIGANTAEVLTAPEWAEAEQVAAAVLTDPLAQKRLEGARFEVPLTWTEAGGIVCSTSGIDIVSNGALCDLKTTSTVEPNAWMRHAFKMLYPMQMAWYRRGARANGIDTSGGLFILGVETKGPFEVVELELSEEMIDYADRTVTLWLEKLCIYRESKQWPGYTQSPIVLPMPAWLREGDEADEEAA